MRHLTRGGRNQSQQWSPNDGANRARARIRRRYRSSNDRGADAESGGRAGPASSTTTKQSALRVRVVREPFRYLGLSTLAIGFGQWAQQIGLAWLMYSMTGSAAQLGAISAFRGGVGVITAPLGGWMADRFSRRSVLVWSTFASMVQAVIFAFLIAAGMIQVWEVYLLALSGGIIQSVTQPARQAFVFDVSTPETLPNAIAMNSILQNIARVTGPPLTGALIGFFGNSAPFELLAATQVVAMGLTLLISRSIVSKRQMSGRGAFRDIGDGFRLVWADKSILGLVLVATIPSLLVYPYLPFISLISDQVLHRGAAGYGWLASMAGWGSIGGLLVIAMLRSPRHRGLVMMLSFFLYAGAVFAFAQSTNFYLSCFFLVVAGVFTSVSNVLNNTLIQIAVPDSVRGRVMAVWQMSQGLQPLGALPMGLLVATHGVQVGLGAFMLAAMACFVLFTLCWGTVRRM
ncbi:MAG: MFS transporter [Chloroflexi bacterium]|nr:MAG: MFS transporter [Chloroflexota bacterium]